MYVFGFAFVSKFSHTCIAPTNRRSFFEKVALANGFNPLLPEGWYAVPISSVMSTKAVSLALFLSYVLSKQQKREQKACCTTIRTVWRRLCAIYSPTSAWASPNWLILILVPVFWILLCFVLICIPLGYNTKHRVIFEKYAKANNFNPLLRKAWYSQSHEKMLAWKV